MILVDSSIWVDHLRSADADLVMLLHAGQVLAHPFVIGEIALGSLRDRGAVLGALRGLPTADVATDEEVQSFLTNHRLFGLGIGYVDVHLLASARLTAAGQLWTRDKRLNAVAKRMSLEFAS